nr:reverse transcriptase domain-containing protein [Tanacetum cinerariifolium]
RSRVDPTVLNDFEMATDENGDPPVLDLRTMEELHRDTINAAASGTFMKRLPEECYDLIENMTTHHNNWDTSVQKCESSRSTTSSFDLEIVALKAEMAKINKNLLKVLQITQQVKAVTPRCETYGGPHAYNDCPAIVGQTQNVYAAGANNQGATNRNGDNIPLPGGGDLPVPDLQTMEEFIKVNGVTDDALRLYLFPHSLTHHATAWFNRLPRNSITTFEQMAKMFLGKYFPPSMVTKLRNEITNFHQHLDESLFEAWERYNLLIDRCPNHNMLPVTQIDNFYNRSTLRHRDTINAAAGIKETIMEMFRGTTKEEINFSKMNTASSSGLRTLPSNTVTNLKEDLKGITTRSRDAYKGPMIPTTSSSPKVLEHETKVTKDTVPPTNNGSTKDVQPPGMDECLALADLGASINLMPLSVWNKLSLPKLSPTCMTLKLAKSLISHPLMKSTPKKFLDFPDFLLEETDAFLAINDEPISLEIDDSFYDSEGDILLLEEFFNDDPSSPPLPLQELKVVEPKNEKSSIDEPPVVELKDLPPHLEYAFFEGDDKLPVIMAKDLKDEENTALIKVLKSHKQALACPWVSLVHCVPKKGGFTIVENEENELIPSRLVTSLHASIHSLEKKNGVSFLRRRVIGRAIFKKSCMNLR